VHPDHDFGAQLEAEPRLAAAARPGERQQAAAFQESLQLLQFPLPADKAGQLTRDVIRSLVRRARRGHAAIINPNEPVSP